MSIFCKVGAPGYTASVVFGILTTLATVCAILTIDKVIIFEGTLIRMYVHMYNCSYSIFRLSVNVITYVPVSFRENWSCF